MRYFFHIWTDDECAPDLEGAEFDDDEAALRCAITSAREILEEDIRKGRITASHHFAIEDETGRKVAALPFTLAVTGLPDDPELRSAV
jgi:hypothetical protein